MRFIFILIPVLCLSFPINGSTATEFSQPTDVGLGQQLRQQLGSDCYGFVEHSPSLIRGFQVNESFQLTRDGYPWARFDSSVNLMLDRQEVLVGGTGLGCDFVQPGGRVNLVTRRAKSSTVADSRTILETDNNGSLIGRVEQSIKPNDRLGIRVSARGERYRNAARNIEDTADVAMHSDFLISEQSRLRWDLEYINADWNNGLGVPALFKAPERINRGTNREQPWARYRFNQIGSLLAYEHELNDDSKIKLGYSQVRYDTDYHALYLNPQASAPPLLVDFIYPDQRYRFDAWHAEWNRLINISRASHQLKFAYSDISVSQPDQIRPQQILGIYNAGDIFSSRLALPASAARTLESAEKRLTLMDTMRFQNLELTAGLQYAQIEDDNGTTRQSVDQWLPVASMTWQVLPKVQLMATSSKGATGRQFSSITSATPQSIQGIGITREYELGMRWKDTRWSWGLGVFDLTKPYRFEQQVITVWRGEQHHRGIESTVQWASKDQLLNVAATLQWLKARIQGTGDALLEDREPPGVPSKRGTFYGEYRLGGGSPWVISLSGEAVSRRATFDDNSVYVSGYGNWAAGLEWQGGKNTRNMRVQLTMQNMNNRFAWGDVGGGYAYPIEQRTIGLSLRFD